MKLSELKPGDSFIRRCDIADALRFKNKKILVYTVVRVAGTTDDQLIIRGRELVGIGSDKDVILVI